MTSPFSVTKTTENIALEPAITSLNLRRRDFMALLTVTPIPVVTLIPGITILPYICVVVEARKIFEKK